MKIGDESEFHYVFSLFPDCILVYGRYKKVEIIKIFLFKITSHSMKVATKVVNKYIEAIHACGSDVMKLGIVVPIPTFSEKALNDLCEEFLTYSNKNSIITIWNEVTVVGDLYGNLHNLITIFNKYGLPPKSRYLFLGNMIEFGEYSLEVLTLLLSYNILYPSSVYLLRGTTESMAMGVYKGLRADIESVYRSSNLYERFIKIFPLLPFCSLIFGKIFGCQPETIEKYKCLQDILLLNVADTEVDIPREDFAYHNFNETFGKFNEDKCTEFMENSGIDYIFVGGCPDDQCYHQYNRAFALSVCSENYCCLITLKEGKNNELEMFESCNSITRYKAKYEIVKDQILISTSNRSILRTIMGSQPQFKTVNSPNNLFGNPLAKSMWRFDFDNIIV